MPNARISLRTAAWAGVMGLAGVCPLVAMIGLMDLPRNAAIAAWGRARMETFVLHPEILLVVAVVVAPVLEEALYRGILLPLLRRYCPTWLAVVISAAMFGLTHLGQGLGNAVAAFALGIFFGWLVIRTGSLWAAMLCHAAVNLSWLFLFLPAFGLLEQLLAFDPRLPMPANNPLTGAFPGWWLVISTALVVAGWLRRDRMLPRIAAA